MKIVSITLMALCLLWQPSLVAKPNSQNSFAIAFGSCNKHNYPNPMWKYLNKMKLDLFVWGGDIVYGDYNEGSPNQIAKYYNLQKLVPGYKKLIANVPVLGTWDDHDYGKNNGGKDFSKKKENQAHLLDFLGVPKNDPRRKRKGVYHSQYLANGKVKVILLDARYHKDESASIPNPDILGATQWKWLENELTSSKARINIIVSGIQVISAEHRFEKWADFPKRRTQLLNLIANSKAKGVIFISGDRHIADMSEIKNHPGMSYPLVDITSSGLTHSYDRFKGEPNKYRILTSGRPPYSGDLNYGLLKIDFTPGNTHVTAQIRNKKNHTVMEIKRAYKY